jgi:hypothetical protein
MRKIGNEKSNQQWNPQNSKASVPLDVDEIDSAMERYIRQKYEQKAFMAGKPASRSPTTSSTSRSPTAPMRISNTGSSDDQPPPPPPKPGRRFGFGLRSSSSAFPLGRNHGHSENPKKGASIPPLVVGKESRVFGAAIGVTESEQGLDYKLLQLKEMGFPDEKRNSTVLKGNNGDLEKTIESLVRLGEGTPTGFRTSGTSSVSSRQNTPALPESRSAPFSIGASVTRVTKSAQQTPLGTPSTARSNNPFDIPQAQASQQSAFESAFENMTIAPAQTQANQSQALFPNSTGGATTTQPQLQQTYQQSMTPPVPQMQQFANFNNPYAQQAHNPFITNQQPISPPHSANNPYINMQQNMASPNPFLNQTVTQNQMLSPQQAQFPPQSQVPQQWAQNMQSPQQAAFIQSPDLYGTQLFSPNVLNSPFQLPSPGYFNPHNPYQSQMQGMMPQPTGRIDKSSIMALYNYPQLAPAQQTPSPQSTEANNTSPPPQAAILPPGVKSPQRSVTMPVAASKNPFAAAGNPSAAPVPPPQTNSTWRESMDGGRHSPDAFASLSARFVR